MPNLNAPRQEPARSTGEQVGARRSRRVLWVFLFIVVLGLIACGIVWAEWTQDSVRTGPREVRSDDQRLSAPAASAGATPHPDAPTTSTGAPSQPRPGTDPNVNPPTDPASPSSRR